MWLIDWEVSSTAIYCKFDTNYTNEQDRKHLFTMHVIQK